MRTRLSPWQIKNGVGEGAGSMKYIGVDYTTIAHVANESVIYRIPFPADVEGVLVHTIRVESELNVAFTVDLMDGNTNKTIYESLEETKFHYDQVNVPYKPSEKAFFVRILNKSGSTTKFNIEIRGVEVR